VPCGLDHRPQLRQGIQPQGGSIVAGRIRHGGDVAGAVAFLTGPDASFIPGHTLTVDGVSSCREHPHD
jgi:NAD(P)-dependent dehydrogenase (short-subunit alcohol dehydrogenase family)